VRIWRAIAETFAGAGVARMVTDRAAEAAEHVAEAHADWSCARSGALRCDQILANKVFHKTALD
jgi:hypothetical protein